MAPLPPLKGESPRHTYVAKDENGAEVEPNQAIFPIVSQYADGTFRLIGTGFFIAVSGIFVTARHVLEDVLDANGVATAPIGLFQFLTGGTYHVRPIHMATRHERFDVAIGFAAPMHHKSTGLPLPNRFVTLDASAPNIGEHITTFAYPKTLIRPGKPQLVHFEPTFFAGKITEHFPNGRDSFLMPGNCYQTTLVLHGGASGGPVFGQSGAVFGLNSSSVGDEDVSFVSSVWDAVDLAIPNVAISPETTPRTTSLRELIARGVVRVQNLQLDDPRTDA